MEHLITVKTMKAYDEAVAVLKGALLSEGFDIVTELDVKGLLTEWSGFRHYDLIGAYNSGLLHAVLSLEPDAGPLMSLQIAVYEAENGGSVVVAFDTERLLTGADGEVIEDAGVEIMTHFERTLIQLLKPARSRTGDGHSALVEC